MRRLSALSALLLMVPVGAGQVAPARADLRQAVVAFGIVDLDISASTNLPAFSFIRVDFRGGVVTQDGTGADLILTVYGYAQKGPATVAIRERLNLQAGTYSYDKRGVRVSSAWRGHPLNLIMTASSEPPTPYKTDVIVGSEYATLLALVDASTFLGRGDILGLRSCKFSGTYNTARSGAGTSPVAVDMTVSRKWKTPNCSRR